jgi:hypothetical protein
MGAGVGVELTITDAQDFGEGVDTCVDNQFAPNQTVKIVELAGGELGVIEFIEQMGDVW